MSRVTPYNKKPTDSWKEGIEKLGQSTLYLVARSAPIIFSIKDEDNVYKVILGNAHSCNCGCKQTDFCIHILFCLTKVLRIPTTDSLCWQRSYTDIEIDAALKKESEFKAIRNIAHRRAQSAVVPPEETADVAPVIADVEAPEGAVKRHLLEGDELDVCPICQDEMVAPDDENVTNNQLLTWCRKGCGKNIHAQCMNMLVQYEAKKYSSSSSNPSPAVSVECPLCRADFNIDALKEDCRGKLTVKYQCVPVRCHRATTSGCCLGDHSGYYSSGPISKSGNVIENDFFRCVECSNAAIMKGNKPVDFCHKCFSSQTSFSMMHIEHHFVNSNGSTQDIRDIQWVPFTNPFCSSSKNAVKSRSGSSGAGSRRSDLLARMNGSGGAGTGAETPIATEALVEVDLAAEIEQIVNSREITPNDYDLLLQLDPRNNSGGAATGDANADFVIPDICDHLIASLPASGKNDPGLSPSSSLGKLYIASPKQFTECWCCSGGTAAAASNPLCGEDQGELKTLLCAHVAHAGCIKAQMDSAISDGDTGSPAFWKLYTASCKHCDCNKPLFPCLTRKKFKQIKVPKEKPPAAESSKPSSSSGQSAFGSSSKSRTHVTTPSGPSSTSQQFGLMGVAGVALSSGHALSDEYSGEAPLIRPDHIPPGPLRGSGSRRALGSMSAGSGSRTNLTGELTSELSLGGVSVSDGIALGGADREERGRLSRNTSGKLRKSSSRKALVAAAAIERQAASSLEVTTAGSDMELGGVSLPQLNTPGPPPLRKVKSQGKPSIETPGEEKKGVGRLPQVGRMSGSQSVKKPKKYADSAQPQGNMSLSLLVNGSTGTVSALEGNSTELSQSYRNPLGKSGPHYSFRRTQDRPDSDSINLVGATLGAPGMGQAVREPEGSAPVGKRIRAFPSKRLKQAQRPDVMLNVTPTITYAGSGDGDGGDIGPYEVNSAETRTIHVQRSPNRTGRGGVTSRPTIPATRAAVADLSIS